MTNADCLALMMGDDLPHEIEDLFYRLDVSFVLAPAGYPSRAGRPLKGGVFSFRISLFLSSLIN